MPKVVDHEERRRHIAQAMWRVIARDGLAAASARTVAAESAWSLGAVRHYFASQDQLLLFATTAMVDGVTARIRSVLTERRPGPARCQAVVEHLLPLDDERTGEVRVWLAVLIRAHVDSTFDELRIAGWQGTRQICRLVVTELAGQPPPADLTQRLPRRFESHAASLHAWIDGLTLHAATVPELLPPDEVRREVRGELRRLREALSG